MTRLPALCAVWEAHGLLTASTIVGKVTLWICRAALYRFRIWLARRLLEKLGMTQWEFRSRYAKHGSRLKGYVPPAELRAPTRLQRRIAARRAA